MAAAAADRLLVQLGRRGRSGRRRAGAVGRPQSGRQDGTAATATTVAMPTLPKRAYRRERGAIDGVRPIG